MLNSFSTRRTKFDSFPIVQTALSDEKQLKRKQQLYAHDMRSKQFFDLVVFGCVALIITVFGKCC